MKYLQVMLFIIVTSHNCFGSKQLKEKLLPQHGVWLPETTKPACPHATYITHLWKATPPPNAGTNFVDNTFIYFYQKNMPYYCFSNTFREFSQDTLLKGKTPTKTYVQMVDNGNWLATSIDSTDWITLEHYFHAQKFTSPKTAYDLMLNEGISVGNLPQAVKKFILESHLESPYANNWAEWDKISPYVMLKAIRAKFTEHPALKEILLGTYPKIIVEDTKQAKYAENIWGAGADYSGCNLLGQILMTVRQELHDGVYYKFETGDSLTYYNLLNGKSSWKQDLNPDAKFIPAGYNPKQELQVTVNSNSIPVITQQQIVTHDYTQTLTTLLYSGLSALSGFFGGVLHNYFKPNHPTLSLVGTVGATLATAHLWAENKCCGKKPAKLVVFGAALAGYLVAQKISHAGFKRI